MQEMVDDDETYSIASIKHNDNYSVFDLTMDSDTLGFSDSFAVLGFYIYGAMYSIFSGAKVDNIVVNFYDPDGNLIQSANSSEMDD